MAIGIGDDPDALRTTVRRFLDDRCPPESLRALLDADVEELPSFWKEVGDLGWVGLHVAEDNGGQGYGLLELAVVLEAFGRAMAPGPLVWSALAAACLQAGGGPNDLLRDLADGSLVGTVAIGGLDAVPVAGIAGLVVWEDEGTWRVSTQFTAEPCPSFDLTRRVFRVRPSEGAPVQGLDTAGVRALAATMLAAEAAGIADWCTATAAEHARTRHQFGGPIGQFQGVKHRCADMLVALEQAVAAAEDAAATAADPLSAAAAGAIGPDAAVRTAKDCIQVLGGIGFTWEHDAHLHLRRAVANRQLLGGGSVWRSELATMALGGARRQLRLELGSEVDDVRAEVQAFAADCDGLDRVALRKRMVDGGWEVPHWPVPWGRDAGPVEQLAIDEELRAAGLRRARTGIGAWAAPTILAHGTAEQQERFIRPTLYGEIEWCQLFSEPEAGSDLASLRTRAVRDEERGGWRIIGQKVWTSMATSAHWGMLLARTNASAPKHLGITYFLLDMTSPGIDVRPLREITGEAMFSEVFLDDVFIPDDDVVGAVDGGWPLARTTLANERVAMSSGSTYGSGVEALLELVGDAGAAADDPVVLDQVGELVAEAQTIALLGFRSVQRAIGGAEPGPESSVRKLLGVEHDQRVQELALQLLGPAGARADGVAKRWSRGFLASRCLTIAGGTSEVQRNVIGERLLGLPRDPGS